MTSPRDEAGPASGTTSETGLDATGSTRPASVQGAAAFSKYMRVLQAIADDPGRIDMARLTKAMPYPRGTLYRIVAALIAEGLVKEERSGGMLQLGHRLITFASKSWESSDLRSAARDEIERLRRFSGETVHLAVPSGLGMVYIDKLESPRTVRMTSRIGTRVELYSTSVGKAYLAALPPDLRRETVNAIDFRPRTPNTISNAADLLAELDRIAARGYAIDNEENEGEIRCFGCAIRDRNGVPVGSVSVSIPLHRHDEITAIKIVEELQAVVEAISRSIATFA